MDHLTIGFFYLNIKLNNEFISEIEFGLEECFNLSYYHTLHLQTQVHCLSLGLTYLYWKGIPILDKN
jgi:hypothetical protein